MKMVEQKHRLGHQSLLFVALLSDQFILSEEQGGDFSVGTFYEYLLLYRPGIKSAALDLC